MATLNTLRTRFGFVLTGVIALVLLAFIFSPNDFINFSGGDPVVAEMNGRKVTYSDYARMYSDVQAQSGVTEVGEQEAAMLYQSTWQALVAEYVLAPGLAEMGLTLGASEYGAVIRGELPTQTMYSAFGNMQTGGYDAAAVTNFIMSSRGNAQAEAAWADLIDQAKEERTTMKFLALIMSGVYANELEGKISADGQNKVSSGRWASKRYADIPDAEVSVSDAELKSAYEARKELFKREPSRSISYVTFRVEPSSDDLAAVESKIMDLAEGFVATPAADLRAFVRESRSGSVTNNYMSASQLSVDESEALVKGDMFGPRIVNGDRWRISRVMESVTVADTLSLRHIVLPYTAEALADSLLIALKGGADFAEAATQHSSYAQTAQLGGEVGAVPFSSFEDEFAAALSSARKGDIVKVAVGDMIQLIQVYDASARNPHYKVASIELQILPSQKTRTEAHSAAGQFAVEATANSANFSTLAAEASVLPYKAVLSSSSRVIDALDGSTDVARWAHKAKSGDVSEIFSVTDGYAVAVVTNVDNNEYESFESASGQLGLILMNEKKYDYIKSKLSGGSFDQQVASIEATTGEFSGVNYNSYYIQDLGVEPAVVGAISATDRMDVVSSPIKGSSGVYIFEVNSIEDSEYKQSTAAERASIESRAQQMTQSAIFSVVESLGNIVDKRGDVL